MKTKMNILIATNDKNEFIRLCGDVTDLIRINEPDEPNLKYRFRTNSVLTLYKHSRDVTDVSRFCNEYVYATKNMIYIAETYHKINICEKLVNYLDKYE